MLRSRCFIKHVLFGRQVQSGHLLCHFPVGECVNQKNIVTARTHPLLYSDSFTMSVSTPTPSCQLHRQSLVRLPHHTTPPSRHHVRSPPNIISTPPPIVHPRSTSCSAPSSEHHNSFCVTSQLSGFDACADQQTTSTGPPSQPITQSSFPYCRRSSSPFLLQRFFLFGVRMQDSHGYFQE